MLIRLHCIIKAISTPQLTPLQGTAQASALVEEPGQPSSAISGRNGGGAQACVNDQAASKDSLGEVLPCHM